VTVPVVSSPPAIGSGQKQGDVKVNPKDGQKYVWIPPGTFIMGCSPGDSECYKYEQPPHQVTITKGFWLGQTPVTQSAYERVTGKNPSNFKGANLPAEAITWDEAQSYCREIGGRLPTEAEWEYAARGGSTSARYGELDDIAWYSRNNSGFKTHEVGQKRPNAFGLYDMLGNVTQWTADRYGPYEQGNQQDPVGAPSGDARTLRGAHWGAGPMFVRVSYRKGAWPVFRLPFTGARCVGE
jgi:formylglycine-generating enzyme required for sulfatase activity